MKRYESYKDSGVKWLGEIPGHWEVTCLRRLLKRYSVKGHPNKPLLSVTREKGVILRGAKGDDGNNNIIPEDLSGYKHVKKGQFVINKMKSWQGSYGVSDFEGIVSPAYFVYDLDIADKRFFSWAIRSKNYVPFFMQYSKGIRVDQWDLTPENVKSIPFFIPPKSEQTAIANYLDSVTSKIDEAISQQQKMIDLLNERKQIIIQNAVTKGLDPNAKMKDSGVEWIGEIPENWEVRRLRNYLRIFSEKGYSHCQLLSVTREMGVILRDKENIEENHNFVPDDLSGYKHINKGDFVINKMKSWQGSYGLSDYEGIVSPAYFTCKLSGIDKKYFSTAIRSKAYIGFFNRYSKGIRLGQWDLDPLSMKEIPFIEPPLIDQQKIYNYLSEINKVINIEIEKCNKMISLLQERKQIIINDVVTGKVKVI